MKRRAENQKMLSKKKNQREKERTRMHNMLLHLAPWDTRSKQLNFVPSTSLPSISTPVVASSRTGSIPYMGKQQLPGLAGVTAGKGVSKCPPVSVCQYVSTTLHTLRPTTS